MVCMLDIIRAILGKGKGKRVLEEELSDNEDQIYLNRHVCFILYAIVPTVFLYSICGIPWYIGTAVSKANLHCCTPHL
jgi:hypothetical protein